MDLIFVVAACTACMKVKVGKVASFVGKMVQSTTRKPQIFCPPEITIPTAQDSDVERITV